MRRHDRHTLLIAEGDDATELLLIRSGVVELSKRTGERVCGVMILSGGDLLMPTAVLFDEPYLTSARTLTAAHIAHLPASTVRTIARECAPFALALNEAIGAQWRMAVRHILDLKCRSAPERLGAFLLRLVDSGADDHAVPEIPFAKKDLAARLGMTAETLSRAAQTVADHGLLVRGSRIIVRDREQIERFCGPDPYVLDRQLSSGVL